MKKNIKALAMLPIIMALFAIQSCKQESNVTPVVENAFTQPVATSPVVRADGTARFTGSTVTLAWSSEAAGSDAQSWDVYFGTNSTPPLYKSGVTQTSLDVPVEDGKTYYWRVVVKDARGVITDSYFPGYQNFTFTAVNGLNPDMSVDMTTTTNVATAVGMDLPPDDVVHMRLLVLSADTSVIINSGASSETFDGFGSLPDGTYQLATDVYSTKNFGDYNAPVSLSFSLNFQQLGVIDTTLTFANAMTNSNVCDSYRTYLATVKKVGPVYTIQSSLSQSWNFDISGLVGSWSGSDSYGYATQTVTNLSADNNLQVTGLGVGWMGDFWGETITDIQKVNVVIDWSNGGFTIPKQYYITTSYLNNGKPSVYYISGTGKFETCGDSPKMIVDYDLVYDDGFDVGGWLINNGYPALSEEITLDVNGTKSAFIGRPRISKANFVKPKR